MARARYEVTGTFPIEERDEDGKWVKDVPPGGTVVLDDERVNVRALVEAGQVKPNGPTEVASTTLTAADQTAVAATIKNKTKG